MGCAISAAISHLIAIDKYLKNLYPDYCRCPNCIPSYIRNVFAEEKPEDLVRLPNTTQGIINYTKLRDFSPLAKYTDRATAACRRS
jgi:hypothetical protein